MAASCWGMDLWYGIQVAEIGIRNVLLFWTRKEEPDTRQTKVRHLGCQAILLLLLRFLVQLRHFLPVHNIEDGAHVVWPHIAIFQVIGVLPDINA